jgi:hypothetical protein
MGGIMMQQIASATQAGGVGPHQIIFHGEVVAELVMLAVTFLAFIALTVGMTRKQHA